MTTEIGEKIKLARERHGKSQGDVARYLGIWSNTVSRWELGQSYPRGINLTRLGELLPELAESVGVG